MKFRSKLASVALIAGLLAIPLAAFAQGYPGASGGQIQNFNNFLNSHQQVASDLSIHPRLVNNSGWLARHPELEQYLAHHPEIRHQLHRNPMEYMSAQGSYGWQRGQRSGWYQGWHRGWYQGERTNFNGFLGQHPGMGQELSEHPNFVNDQGWLRKHPNARQYFAKHPGVANELRGNPHQFISREHFRPAPKGSYRHQQRPQGNKHQKKWQQKHGN